jgi:hypothetical protein
MGYNTVAFVLNDFARDIAQAPYQAAYLLAHPPLGPGENEKWMIREMLNRIAEEHKEPRIHGQALEVLPTFHASDTQYFRAGGNCIAPLKVVRYGKTKEGKHTITLELPEWWDKKRHQ